MLTIKKYNFYSSMLFWNYVKIFSKKSKLFEVTTVDTKMDYPVDKFPGVPIVSTFTIIPNMRNFYNTIYYYYQM